MRIRVGAAWLVGEIRQESPLRLSDRSIPAAGNSQCNSPWAGLHPVHSGIKTIMMEVKQAREKEVGNELRMAEPFVAMEGAPLQASHCTRHWGSIGSNLSLLWELASHPGGVPPRERDEGALSE